MPLRVREQDDRGNPFSETVLVVEGDSIDDFFVVEGKGFVLGEAMLGLIKDRFKNEADSASAAVNRAIVSGHSHRHYTPWTIDDGVHGDGGYLSIQKS